MNKTPDALYVEVNLRSVRLVRNERVILRDVDWRIRPGERWVLAGGNGAGKTQLMKLVAGSVWPTPTGREMRSYRWRDETFSTPFEVKDEIGYLGPERQDKYARYGWNHTVAQIVGTGLHRTDIPLVALTAGDQRRVAALLGRLGIAALAERRFLSLSYGERRLTLLARTLASGAKLLLLDELLNGLDDTNRARALGWLQQTTRSRLPWILTTHRVEDVPDCVTHVLVLEEGRVVYRRKVGAGGKGLWTPLRRWLHSDHDRPPPAPALSRPRRKLAARRAGRPLVRLVNASVYLDEHVALEKISFEVHKGECWVVHGSNGSGKTTLLRTLYGDHGVAVGGSVERAGVVPGVPLQAFKTRVGLVAPHLQTDHPQDLTVAEVVESGRHASIGLNDPATAADKAAARRALAFFELSHLAARTLVELSYGQMRRVLFARAFVRRPQLLLLDEPFAGVDGPTRRELLAHLETLLAQGTALVMATHHRSEWPVSATHELQLAGGRARYCGPVRSAKGKLHGVSRQ
jgi:molybdate transport system ATP-binding protein